MAADQNRIPDEQAMRRLLSEHASDLPGIVLRLAWLEGLKRDEICALTWEQVDFERQLLRLTGRDVPLDGQTANALRQWRSALDRRIHYNRYVASSLKTKKRATPSTVSNAARVALDRAGMPDIRLEDLRSDFIRRLGAEHGEGYALRVAGVSALYYQRLFGGAERERYARTGSGEMTEEKRARLWQTLQENRAGGAGIALWLSQQANLMETEIADLTWDQLDLARGTVHLPRGDILLIQEVIAVLAEEKARRGESDDPHVVLADGTRRPVSRGQLSAMLRELMIKNGLDGVSVGRIRGATQIRYDLDRILHYARTVGRVTRKDAAAQLGVSSATAYNRLTRLVAEGALTPSGKGYVPTERAVPREQWQDAVRAAADARGFVTIAQTAALLRVGKGAARRLLRQMAAEGKLTAGTGNRRYLPPDDAQSAI